MNNRPRLLPLSWLFSSSVTSTVTNTVASTMIALSLASHLSLPALAADGMIQGLRYDASSKHFQVDTTGPVKAMVNTLNIAGRKRIIIDLDNAEIGAALPRDVQLLQELSSQIPELRNLTINQYGGNGRPIVRILLDLQGDPGVVRLVRNQGPHIEMELSAGPANASSGKTLINPPTLTRLEPSSTPKTAISPKPVSSQEHSAPSTPETLNPTKEHTLQQTIQAQKNQLDALQQQVKQLSQSLEAAKSASKTSDTHQSAELQSRLAQLTQQNEQLQAETERLKKQTLKPAPTSTSSGGNPELQNLKQQVATAQQSLNEAIRTINGQNQEIAYLRNQVSSVKTNMSSPAPEEVSQLQATLSQKEETIRTLQRQLAAQSSTSKPNSGTASEIATLNQQISTLKANLAQATQGHQAEQSSSSSLKEAINRLTQENHSLQNTVDTLKASKSGSGSHSEESRQLQSQVSSLQTQLNTLNSQHIQSAQEAQKEISRLKQELAKNQVSAKNSAGNPTSPSVNTAQSHQLEELNRQISNLKAENSRLAAKASSNGSPSSQEAEQNYQQAKAAQNNKNTALALDKFKTAQLLEPSNAHYAIDYSIALAEDGQLAEATDIMRRYLQKNPGDRDAYNQLGKIYLLNDQPDAANQAFARAFSISTLNNYATSLKKLDRMEEAENVFKLALSISPKDSEVLFNLGNLYNTQNKLDLARNKYLEAIQLRPDFAEAHYNLGLIFSKLGDNPKAVAHLEKFLELSPGARNAETIRAYIARLKT